MTERTNLNIGIDVDGVLADFNLAYQKLVIKVTGKDLFPMFPYPPPCWNYLTHVGYTKEEDKAVWAAITADPYFWETLPVYETTQTDLDILAELSRKHSIYFLTTRLGAHPKAQTERWIMSNGYWNNPTVLITADKGPVAKGLKLDAFIDDKPENCQAVTDAAPMCKVGLLDATWNQECSLPRVNSLVEFLESLGLDVPAVLY